MDQGRGLDRDRSIGELRARDEPWDVVVIGGGATGLGAALDAASRGYATALVEGGDLAGATSSASTKLIHGGVRYLRQGNISLVREALAERALLLRLAPGLVSPLRFVIPTRGRLERLWYGTGLRMYDWLARGRVLERSRGLPARAAREAMPTVRGDAMAGGVAYTDARFDDARFGLAIAVAAARAGATVVNHCPVTSLLKGVDNRVAGVVARDSETGELLEMRARVVINATGPYVDGIRRMDDPSCEPMIAPSRGAHVAFPRRFFPGDAALIVPKTPDGRVLFAIPFEGVVIAGTTDTGLADPEREPAASRDEVGFILETLGRYLDPAPAVGDLVSVFAGVRPLVRPGGASGSTATISREHTVVESGSGLVTIAGGKWTTYRLMARDVVDRAAVVGGLGAAACATGSISLGVGAWPSGGEPLHAGLSVTEEMVRHAARAQMARTVEDVLARRTRSTIVDARASVEAAPAVARVLAEALGRDGAWVEEQVAAFGRFAERVTPPAAV